MAVDEQFAQAWLNVPHKCFGYKLKPFSLWHRFLLLVTESKVFEVEDITALDVYKAAYVCSLSYPNPPRLTPWGKLRTWFHLRPRAVTKNVNNFTDYLKDYVTQPEFWEKKDGTTSNKSGPPDELSSVVALMQMGMSEKDAWDCPCGMASWYTAAYASWNGADLDFITPDERDMRENFDERLAAAKAQTENG